MPARERIHALRGGLPVPGTYLLYWMEQAQRATDNPALTYAVERANGLGLPVVVGLGLTADYPETHHRHLAFVLEGLVEVAAHLRRTGIAFVPRLGSPAEVALGLAEDAALVVCDRGYLRPQRAWRHRVAEGAPCPVVEVETESVVPIELASDRAETGARTLRPKIHAQLHRFPEPAPETGPHCSAEAVAPTPGLDPSAPNAVLRDLALDSTAAPIGAARGGYSQARERLQGFIEQGLTGYADHGSDPVREATSHLSPYLHAGQIAATEVYRTVAEAHAPERDRAAYLEQLVVRRELAFNHCWFRPDTYDRFACLPDWAQSTLAEHAEDDRDPCYAPRQLETGETDDPYWNAAMHDMRRRGFVPNYLRMYWGKKILEWSATPEEAFATAVRLNDRYFLDGRDPNGYANVAWCFGLHDRGWPQRPIFGKVRYMSAAGLRRKFPIDRYVHRIQANRNGEDPT